MRWPNFRQRRLPLPTQPLDENPTSRGLRGISAEAWQKWRPVRKAVEDCQKSTDVGPQNGMSSSVMPSVSYGVLSNLNFPSLSSIHCHPES